MGDTCVDVVCCSCGKTFSTRLSYVKLGRGKFCSKKCSSDSRKHHKPSSKISEYKCPCGKTFFRYKSNVAASGALAVYCSRSCKNKYHTEGLFKHGHTGYRKRYDGDDISYAALHDWVHSVKNKTGICEHCNKKQINRT